MFNGDGDGDRGCPDEPDRRCYPTTRELAYPLRARLADQDPAEITALFTPGARYLTQPDAEPWLGREAIVAGWLDRADPATGRTTRLQILGPHRFPDQGGLRGFDQGWTVYADGDQTIAFDDLWAIDLGPDGRAGSPTEWWMRRPPAEE